LRAINHVFPELLEGTTPLDIDVTTNYQNFQKVFGYLCVVMKHPIVIVALQNFQRGPSFSARVSPCSYAWRPLIKYFDHRDVGRTIGLLEKLLHAQGETDREYIRFLRRIMNSYQDTDL
jgi:hypothetical protein